MAAHFVLDQNFPLYVTGFEWTGPSLRISRLSAIDPSLTAAHEDWEVLLALHRQRDVDRFVTNVHPPALIAQERAWIDGPARAPGTS